MQLRVNFYANIGAAMSKHACRAHQIKGFSGRTGQPIAALRSLNCHSAFAINLGFTCLDEEKHNSSDFVVVLWALFRFQAPTQKGVMNDHLHAMNRNSWQSRLQFDELTSLQTEHKDHLQRSWSQMPTLHSSWCTINLDLSREALNRFDKMKSN